MAEDDSDERMAVLRLLESGKITAAEAADLLRALGDRAPSGGTARPTDWMEQAARGAARRSRMAAEYWARHADEVVARAGERTVRAAELIGDGVSRAVANIPDIMERAVRAGWGTLGPGFRFEDGAQGTLEGGAEGPAGLDVEGWNGGLSLSGADGADALLFLRKTVHAPSEAEARRVADSIRAEVQGRQVLVRRQSGTVAWPSALAVEARLPREARWGGVARTSNGAVEISSLWLQGLRVETSNGRVRLAEVRGEDVEVFTTNGSIEAHGLGGHLELRTSNGSIELAPAVEAGAPCEVRATTSNGSIEIRLPAGVAVEVEASTSNGRLEPLGLGPDVPRPRGIGRLELSWRSPDWEESDRRLTLDLRTTNGSIRLL